MRLAQRLAVVVLVGLLVSLGIGTWDVASAHANLVGSTPAKGASLLEAPRTVQLRFDENIRDPSAVIVTGPDGRRVDHGATRVVDAKAAVDVSVRFAGTYTVAYRVISADGHPVADSWRFEFHGPGAPAAPARVAEPVEQSDGVSTWWIVVAAGAVVVLGAAVLMVRRRTRSSGRAS